MSKNLEWDQDHEIRNTYEDKKNKLCLDIDVGGQFDDNYVVWLESQLAAEREWKNKILTEVHTAYENLFLGHTELAGKQLSKLISNLK
jgi:hypothetical protein